MAADAELLYFVPVWSPDGEWLAYQACRYHEDPAHDWSDLCISRPDGSDARLLTSGQELWFGAAVLLFCRAPTGDSPSIWVADADGGNPRALTKGVDDQGADHPRWVPSGRR